MLNHKDLTSIDRISVLGGSGSGKSNSGFVIIKEIRKKQMPVWIIDTTNDYGDLKKTGLFKEMKAHKLNARGLPKRLRNTHESVIIKFSKMKNMQDKRRFVTEFLKGCFDKKNKYPALIVIDEVHRFCPQQQSKDPVIKNCKYWVNELLSDGRKHGYGSLIISQRASKFDKDSLAETDKSLIHSHTLQRDITQLRDQLKRFEEKKDEVLDLDLEREISKLETGEIFFVDYENFEWQRYIMPEDKTKRLGRTPRARAVIPKKYRLKDRLRELDSEIGLDENEKGAIIVTGLVLFIFFILVLISMNIKEKLDVIEGI